MEEQMGTRKSKRKATVQASSASAALAASTLVGNPVPGSTPVYTAQTQGNNFNNNNSSTAGIPANSHNNNATMQSSGATAHSAASALTSGGNNGMSVSRNNNKKVSRKKPTPRKAPGAAASQIKPLAVDMNKLDLEALRRYKKYYNLRSKPTGPRQKLELAQAVARHFAAQNVEETDTIEKFVSALRTRME